MNATLTADTSGKSSVTPVQTQFLLRKCACGGSPGVTGECENCNRQKLSVQRSAEGSEVKRGNPGSVPPIVHDVLRSPGHPLDAETRAFMEPRFGHDFSRVRVHTGAQAAESAQAVNARAYTLGQDIAFGAGRYAPDTTAGKELLAHELSHTLQQSDAAEPSLRSASSLRVSQPDDPQEREADAIASRVVGSSNDSLPGGAVDSLAASPTSLILRQSEGEETPVAAEEETQPAVESEPAEEVPGIGGEGQDTSEKRRGRGCPRQRRAVAPGTFLNFVDRPFNVNSGCSRVAIHLTGEWELAGCGDPGNTFRIEVRGPTAHSANMRAGNVVSSCIPARPIRSDVSRFVANPGSYFLRIFGPGDPVFGRLMIHRGSYVEVSG